jgi:hypothetical protein
MATPPSTAATDHTPLPQAHIETIVLADSLPDCRKASQLPKVSQAYAPDGSKYYSR